MIPKMIHFCWFGRGEKPKLAKKCIKSWKKFCPDYKLIEWNEDNFDISACPLYVRQAYEAKKWAFVTDYVRLKVVYENGGVYLDTDVQLLKSLDGLLDNTAYFGFESDGYIATGLGFGAVKGCGILDELMRDYDGIPFVLEDGSFDSTTCPSRNTEIFLRNGLIADGSMQMLDGGVLILPREYLSPTSYNDIQKRITANTVSIHHFAGSWQSSGLRRKMKKDRAKNGLFRVRNRIFSGLFGKGTLEKLQNWKKKRWQK